MKKFGDLMHDVDQSVDKSVGPALAIVQKYFIFFSSTFLLLLTAFFIYKIFYNRPYALASTTSEDIVRIERILKQIDVDCNILNIRHDRAFIDFLTVEKFAGSMVGCLNLVYPSRWKGPYLKMNPSIQGKLYEIVRGSDGYFVVPGNGVVLPNGFVVGKGVVFSVNTPIAPMLKPGGKLFYQGMPLGVQLKFTIGDWDTPRPTPSTIDKINDVLKEFNEALPYAQRGGGAQQDEIASCDC